jgi:hypothetical protein
VSERDGERIRAQGDVALPGAIRGRVNTPLFISVMFTDSTWLT